jgi:hypothetical protein
MSNKKSNLPGKIEIHRFNKDDSKNFMGLTKIPEQPSALSGQVDNFTKRQSQIMKINRTKFLFPKNAQVVSSLADSLEKDHDSDDS